MPNTLGCGTDRASRLAWGAAFGGTSGKLCSADQTTLLLEAIIETAIEGDNQKQADFLARALENVDPARIHHLRLVQSVLALPDHLCVFERDHEQTGLFICRIAKPQARRTRCVLDPHDRRDPHLSRTQHRAPCNPRILGHHGQLSPRP
jgi:hypothetical protein